MLTRIVPLASVLLGVAVSSAGASDAIPESALQRLKDATAFIKVECSRGTASGSGFIISSSGGTGYLVTNAHVVRPARLTPISIKVVIKSGNKGEFTADAQVVGLDEERDLAILKVTDNKLPQALDLRSNLTVRETLPVFILGYPFGDRLSAHDGNPEISIARGSVSSLRKDENGRVKYVQIDGDVNPGNSGGPIVDGNGALIGVSVAKVVGTNIGIAIPPQELQEMLMGRVAEVSIVQVSSDKGVAKFRVTAQLIDPMSRIRSVSLLLCPKDRISTKAQTDSNGNWSYFYPNQAFALTAAQGQPSASGEFTVSNTADTTVTYLAQTSYLRGDGKTVYTEPNDLRLSFGSTAAPAPAPRPRPAPPTVSRPPVPPSYSPGTPPSPSAAPPPPPAFGKTAPGMTLGPAAAEALAAVKGANELDPDGTSFRLPDEVADATLAGGGAYLVLQFKVLNKIGVFDLAQCKMHREIPTPEAGVIMGAGGNLVVFYAPRTKTFEKWNIKTGEKAGSGQSRVNGLVTHLAMGLSNEREAIISYAVGTQALDHRGYAMLDLSGFAHQDIQANFHNTSYRDSIHIRANPDLTCVTMWASSHSPTGFILGRRGGAGQPWNVAYEHESYGALVPSDDGTMVLSSTSGVFGADGRRLQDFHGSLVVPVQGTNLFLQIEKDLTAHVRAPDMQNLVKFFKAPESAKPDYTKRGELDSDRLAIASGTLGRVAFVDNNGLRLRIMDLGIKVDGDRIVAKPGFELPGSGNAPSKPGLAVDPAGAGNRLSDQVGEVKMAYGGACLALRYKTKNKVAILDIAEGRIIKEIPTEVPDSAIAAGGRFLLVYSPRSRTLEKWDLSSMTRAAQAASRVNGQITYMAMGMDEEREALISYAVGTGALDQRLYAMLDLSSFAHQDIQANFHNTSFRDTIHMRTNPDLTCVAMWASSHTPSGFILGRRGGVGQPWNVIYEHSSFGALNPTRDGLSVLTTSGGLYGLQAKPIKVFKDSRLLPVHGADLFMQVEKTGLVRIMDLDFKEKAPAFSLPQGFEIKIEGWASGPLYGEELVAASARANKVVLVDNNALTVSVLPLGLEPADVPPFSLPKPGSKQQASAPAPAPAPDAPVAPAPAGPASPPAASAAPAAQPPAPAVDEEQMKKDCQAWGNMADNYVRSGLLPQAREYLKKIIERYPDSPYAKRAKEKLSELR